jgi:3-hydroxy-9,10-secoandrosta-1,3,5(10)-triene-9,17-dione monooxygenase reductase component
MIETATFRRVLGNYPTGVCAVTATSGSGLPLGMIVGSFSSVSLEPALIGFFPGKQSRTWPAIAETGRFCISVLGSDQLAVCTKLAASGDNKFDGLTHRTSDNGLPIIDGSLAWIDCELHDVVDAGDHYFVMGRVIALEAGHDGDPMLFFKGRYGGFKDLA